MRLPYSWTLEDAETLEYLNNRSAAISVPAWQPSVSSVSQADSYSSSGACKLAYYKNGFQDTMGSRWL